MASSLRGHLAVIERRLNALQDEYLERGRGRPLPPERLEWHLDALRRSVGKAQEVLPCGFCGEDGCRGFCQDPP